MVADFDYAFIADFFLILYLLYFILKTDEI